MSNQVIKDRGEVSRAGSDAIPESATELDSKPEPRDASIHTAANFDLGDAYKLAVGNTGRHLSGKFLEQRSFKDYTRMSEDLKILQKRISLERNESGLSLDGSTVSEIEGESVIDRLKRQVEHDRKLMTALYKELEEERNASAVAANQAMAMITRLQEDKAAIQMEALQCVRMMEEQTEYDNEALQKANDLLAQKEKEIQDLEAELELYKKKLGNMALFEDMLEASYDSNRAKQAHTICSEAEEWVEVGNPKESDHMESSKNDGDIEENVHLEPVANTTSPSGVEGSGCELPKLLQKRSGERSSGQCTDGDSELEALTKELSVLSSRLKALETEHSFLEHSINSLRNGDEGHRFIVEIAGHLRQLHFIWDGTIN